MGTILSAICSNCQFKKKSLFCGFGMNDSGLVCYLPAIDIKTQKLVCKNMYGKEGFANRFNFYTDETMYLKKERTKKHQFEDERLQTNHNLCPRCKQYTLTFVDVGCWD